MNWIEFKEEIEKQLAEKEIPEDVEIRSIDTYPGNGEFNVDYYDGKNEHISIS